MTETDVERAERATFEQLREEAPAVRERLDRFRRALGRWFVDKQRLVDLMTVAAIAQEPLLLVGPPGTAKSDLVLKLRDALGVSEGDYFEYMLTRFTEPSEVLGPIDVRLLREGQWVRRDRGKLPTARLVFLDEIFKSNSAILNVLLTIINERKFYQDGVPTPVRLKVLFAATNEIPEHGDLAALRDRFALKVACRPVPDAHFIALIDSGLALATERELGRRPWAEGHASLADLIKAHRYLAFLMSRTDAGSGGHEQRDRDLFFREDLLHEMRRVIRTLAREDGVFVSDRKVVKLYKLLRAHAWLLHGGAVERDDLRLLAYLGETREQLDVLEDRVPRLLGIS